MNISKEDALVEKTCRHCGQVIWSDGKGAWVDASDGDGCDPDVHEPTSSEATVLEEYNPTT